jgi:hypothetical protein
MILPLTCDRCGSAGRDGASQRNRRQRGVGLGSSNLLASISRLLTPTHTDLLLACPTCKLPEHTTTTQWHRRRLPHLRSMTAKMACHCTTLRTAATTAHPLPLRLPVTRLRQRPSVVTGAMSVLICAPISSLTLLTTSYTDAPPSRSPKASAKPTTAISSTHTGSRS